MMWVPRCCRMLGIARGIGGCDYHWTMHCVFWRYYRYGGGVLSPRERGRGRAIHRPSTSRARPVVLLFRVICFRGLSGVR